MSEMKALIHRFFFTEDGKLSYFPAIFYFIALLFFARLNGPLQAWLEDHGVVKTNPVIVIAALDEAPYSLQTLRMADAIHRVYRVEKTKSLVYAQHIRDRASEQKIDPLLFMGLIAAESSFNPKARSGENAVGLTQVIERWHPEKVRQRNLEDPLVAIEVGAKVLRQCFDRRGDQIGALACYNGARRQEDIEHYVTLVTTRMKKLKAEMSS